VIGCHGERRKKRQKVLYMVVVMVDRWGVEAVVATAAASERLDDD
jgi:hypothetical protein